MEGKNLRMEHVIALLPAHFPIILLLFWIEISILFVCMTKQKKPKNNPKPLPKPDKAKGPVTLARLTFIDEILKKAESQPSVGPRKDTFRQPTIPFGPQNHHM